MIKQLRDAFITASWGFSPDRVVADVKLNRIFIESCTSLGLIHPTAELNRRLLNLRKGGHLKGIKTTRRTSFPEESEYRFASEMAVRFLERRDGVTLDQIICDPERASEFDGLAQQICPGFSSLQYRWAALNLRKAKLLRPELLAQVVPAEKVATGPVEALDLNEIPTCQGLYIFYESAQALYVGECQNLRTRIEKHLEHSDNKGLARWLWKHGAAKVHLEIHVLEPSTSTRVRRAREAELIRNRRPLFNLQRR